MLFDLRAPLKTHVNKTMPLVWLDTVLSQSKQPDGRKHPDMCRRGLCVELSFLIKKWNKYRKRSVRPMAGGGGGGSHGTVSTMSRCSEIVMALYCCRERRLRTFKCGSIRSRCNFLKTKENNKLPDYYILVNIDCVHLSAIHLLNPNNESGLENSSFRRDLIVLLPPDNNSIRL